MTPTLLLTAALSCGQPSSPPGDSVQRQVDARLRVMHIEAALARFGAAARPLIQEYDARGARVLNACDRESARRLLEWHADPEGLNRLPDPEAFLRAATASSASLLVTWASQHGNALRDSDAFAVFLEAPRDYALGYKSLPREAEKRRAARAPRAAVTGRWPDDTTLRILVAAGSFVFVLLVVRWTRKRRAAAAVGRGEPGRRQADPGPVERLDRPRLRCSPGDTSWET